MTEATRQKSLVLILARDLASKLATPAFLVDAQGDLVYFNEAAEGVLGQAFVETHEITASEWAKAFRPVDESGRLIPLAGLPLGIAIADRVPAHSSFMIRAKDGVDRHIEATAFPLYAHTDELVGGMAVFWEQTGN